MHDACSWLLELRLPGVARRAFAVAVESERVAVKKAQVKEYRCTAHVTAGNGPIFLEIPRLRLR